MEKISIVGYGRFGKTLYRLLKDDFSISIFDINKSVKNVVTGDASINFLDDISEIYKNKTVFYCVPISDFEEVIVSHKEFLDDHLLIDVLSVKIHPKKIFEKVLKNSNARAILTHPMFGPDSSKNGFTNLPLVVDRFTSKAEEYKKWHSLFSNKGLNIIEMSAEEHDKIAANSQGVTHFIGRLLEEIKFSSTNIDTTGAKILLQVKEQTCNDTWQLFTDLQKYNPYTKKMRARFGDAYDHLYNILLPDRVSPGFTTFGIQGGIGSFNEEAVNLHINKNHIDGAKINYLYTTEKVLRNLYEGKIDFGLFAISNSLGGVVSESIQAMSKYKFKIIDEFPIPISHHLMKRKSVSLDKLKTIMAHPQVFRQCKNNLTKKYPKLSQKVGEGDLIDTAKAAKELHSGSLPINTAILGSRRLADIYDLEIVENNLEDSKDNQTTFLLVTRV